MLWLSSSGAWAPSLPELNRHPAWPLRTPTGAVNPAPGGDFFWRMQFRTATGATQADELENRSPSIPKFAARHLRIKRKTPNLDHAQPENTHRSDCDVHIGGRLRQKRRAGRARESGRAGCGGQSGAGAGSAETVPHGRYAWRRAPPWRRAAKHCWNLAIPLICRWSRRWRRVIWHALPSASRPRLHCRRSRRASGLVTMDNERELVARETRDFLHAQVGGESGVLAQPLRSGGRIRRCRGGVLDGWPYAE